MKGWRENIGMGTGPMNKQASPLYPPPYHSISPWLYSLSQSPAPAALTLHCLPKPLLLRQTAKEVCEHFANSFLLPQCLKRERKKKEKKKKHIPYLETFL